MMDQPLNSIAFVANTASDLVEPVGNEETPDTIIWWWKNHGLALHAVWGMQEPSRVDCTIKSLKYQQSPSDLYIPNHEMENPSAKWCSFSYCTSKFLKAKMVKVL